MATTVLGAGARLRLQEGLAYLTPALKRLAECILDAPDEVIYQSVTELAEQAGVGDASVIRLCRDLGYKGFQDFKLALAADLALSPRPRSRANDGSAAGVLNAVTDEAVAALQATQALLDPKVLTTAVEALLAARRVLVVGAGASAVTAQDIAYKLLRLGYDVVCPADPHLAAMSATTLATDSVVIAVTRSGTTLDTVRTLEVAKAQGATRILFTQRLKSPAASLASLTLYTAAPESPLSGGSISSKMGQLLVLDALYTLLLAHKPGAEAAVAATALAVTDRNL